MSEGNSAVQHCSAGNAAGTEKQERRDVKTCASHHFVSSSTESGAKNLFM